jgi:hypothetical protein
MALSPGTLEEGLVLTRRSDGAQPQDRQVLGLDVPPTLLAAPTR